MSNFLNTIIIVSILSLVLGFLKIMWNVVTGRMQPLKPKDAGKDDARRGRLLPPEVSPSEELFRENQAKQCPLHGKPYVGIAFIALIEPKQELNVFRQSPRIDGHLQIVVCEDCIRTVYPFKKTGFTWQRRNYKEHPEWASSIITPHLLGSKIGKLWSVKKKSGTDDGWQECLDPDCQQFLDQIHRDAQLTPSELIAKFAVHLVGPNTYLGDQIPERKLHKVLRKCPLHAGETPLVLHYSTSFSWVLVTDKRVCSSPVTTESPPKCVILAEIQTVQNEGNIYQDRVGDHIYINGEHFYGYLKDPVDYLVAFLRELCEFQKPHLQDN